MTELLDFFRETGKQGGKIGGKKRAANLSSKELSEIGKKGALARWGKKKAAKVRSAKAKAKSKA
jgi:hypothetical protein